MTKKVTLNGIELSLPKYDATSETVFDYLDDVVTKLEKGLDKNDANFKMSINVDFEADKPPKHRIHANGGTSKETKEKVASILKQSATNGDNRVAGSVKVNFIVADK